MDENELPKVLTSTPGAGGVLGRICDDTAHPDCRVLNTLRIVMTASLIVTGTASPIREARAPEIMTTAAKYINRMRTPRGSATQS